MLTIILTFIIYMKISKSTFYLDFLKFLPSIIFFFLSRIPPMIPYNFWFFRKKLKSFCVFRIFVTLTISVTSHIFITLTFEEYLSDILQTVLVLKFFLYFCHYQLELNVLGRVITQVKYCFYHITSQLHSQHGLHILMLMLITWLRWCLSCVLQLFFPFPF